MKKINDEIIDRYLNKEYTEEDIQIISGWLHESEEHVTCLFKTEEFLQLGKYETFSDEKFLANAEQRLFRKINPLDANNINRKKHFFTWQKYVAAAVIISLLSIGLHTLFSQGSFLSVESLIEVYAENEVREVELPDGTKIWLNEKSLLKYSPEFAQKERTVFLEGEAYFEVSKDEKMPFLVKSESLDITVLGTIFNIKSISNTQKAEVSLIEGEVQVKGNSNEGMIILSPGQRAELNKENGRMVVKQVDATLDAVWHNDLIPFNQASIGYITGVLEHFYGVHFVLSPDINLTTTYSGAIKRKDSIEEVLSSLKNVIPISYKIVENKIFLLSGVYE